MLVQKLESGTILSIILHSDTVTTDACILQLTQPLNLKNLVRTIPPCRAEP